MSAVADSPGAGRYIGRGLPRPGAKRLLAARGRYTDDVVLPRMLHAAFLRSPYAHARLGTIDVSAAAAMPGVHRVLTGADFEPICTPWVGTLSHFNGMRSAPQRPLPSDKVVWAGQPVVMVIAETRAEAEDALEVIEIAFEELEPVVDLDAARAPDAPRIEADALDNILFRTRIESGSTASAFAEGVAPTDAVGALAIHREQRLAPDADIKAVMAVFDAAGADEMAVVADDGIVLGIRSESYVRRRYAEELDKSQRELFGEA